jgi:hypothetical protein
VNLSILILFFSIFTRVCSLCRGDSLWQFQIALHCTLGRLPSCQLLPSSPSLPHLNHLPEVSLFCFAWIYEVHQPYSLTFFSSIHPPPPTGTPSQYHFIVLSFIINSKFSVQRDFLMCPWCGYTLLWSIQLLPLLSLTPSLPPPIIQQLLIHIITLYLHRCNVFWYCWLSFSFPFPLPLSSIE